MKTRSHVQALSWILGVAFALTGCAQPELAIRVEPTGTWVFVDGEFASPGREATGARAADAPNYERAPKYVEPFDHEMPLRYYGAVRLSGRQPATEDSLTVDWLERRAEVTIDEPFTPWLFPLDFVLECVTYPFVADSRYAHRTSVELEKRPEVMGGVRPRDLTAISTRARRAREER